MPVAVTRPLFAGLASDHRVVGIDLRGNPARRAGWAAGEGAVVHTRCLRSDSEIYGLTRDFAPTLVAIDAPLSLPWTGISRAAERDLLHEAGIRSYPPLLPSMCALTARGIELAAAFRALGVTVIEAYPGGAQDLLGLGRKQHGLELLRAGLERELALEGDESHDELDAVTCVIVGWYFLAGRYRAYGDPAEGQIIVPASE